MIPKTIHYCWFGRGEKPLLAKLCIASWKKYMPEYTYIEWNEENFDINCNIYVKQAYNAGKYAFVSDFVRLHVLYEHGGIYMDTDTEVLENLDKFLVNEAFTGFESKHGMLTCIIGSTKNHKVIYALLQDYENERFINESGEMNLKTNVVRVTDHLCNIGFFANDSLQTISGFTLYPRTYFCPFLPWSSECYFSADTHTIHHFTGSWTKRILKGFKQISYKTDLLSGYLLNKSDKCVAIYGIGEHTKNLLDNYEKYFGKIKCKLLFVISDSPADDTKYHGSLLISCIDLPKYEVDEIIISSFYYEEEMYDMLLSIGIEKSKIRRINNVYSTPVFNSPEEDEAYYTMLEWTDFKGYYNESP